MSVIAVDRDDALDTFDLYVTGGDLCRVLRWEECEVEVERGTGRARYVYTVAYGGGSEFVVDRTEWIRNLPLLTAWATGVVQGAAAIEGRRYVR